MLRAWRGMSKEDSGGCDDSGCGLLRWAVVVSSGCSLRIEGGDGGGGVVDSGCVGVMLQGNASAAPLRFLSLLVKVGWRGSACQAFSPFSELLETWIL